MVGIDIERLIRTRLTYLCLQYYESAQFGWASTLPRAQRLGPMSWVEHLALVFEIGTSELKFVDTFGEQRCGSTGGEDLEGSSLAPTQSLERIYRDRSSDR